MKKVLALILAVMMIFASLAVNVSAANATETAPEDIYVPSEASSNKYKQLLDLEVIQIDQAMLTFDAQSGTFYDKVNVYGEDGKFELKSGITGVYYMIPDNFGGVNTNLVPGRFVILPQVVAPAGKVFDGWYCYYDGEIYSAGSKYEVPGKVLEDGKYADPLTTFGGVIEFVAFYSPAPVEGDIFSKIITTLIGLIAEAFPDLFAKLGMTADDIVALVGGLFN